MSGLAQIMEEPPGGPNYGRRAAEGPTGGLPQEPRHVPLGVDDLQTGEFMREGGWGIVHAKDGSRAGVSAHRGVLHPDEHVDTDALRAGVEAGLGFTYQEVRSVYRQGRLSDEQRELRGRIDARLLALSRSGANLALLGGLLGFKVEGDSHCEPMDNAVARARAKEDDNA